MTGDGETRVEAEVATVVIRTIKEEDKMLIS